MRRYKEEEEEEEEEEAKEGGWRERIIREMGGIGELFSQKEVDTFLHHPFPDP